tara:strand:- start:801 stop:2390 length:1590 start_codon:yes stop_codon:yes gene_type:complete
MRKDYIKNNLNGAEAKAHSNKIDNQFYYIRAALVNPDGERLDLSKGSLYNISLNDNLFDPFLKAEITLYNDNNAIERTTPTSLNSQNGFTFRGDGRDVLFLEIIPLKNTDKEYKLEEDIKYNQVFSLRNLFTVIEDNDVVIEGVSYKKLKLYDLDQRKLKEKNLDFNSINTIQFSENNSLSGVPLFNLDNDERGNNTGILMRELLKFALVQGDEDIFYTVKPGQASQQSQAKTVVDFENGSSVINYASNAYKKAIDDLNYIYDLHTSNLDSKDFSILKKDYFTGKYTLINSKSFFDRAYNKDSDEGGTFLLEKINISGSGSPKVNNAGGKSPKNTPQFNEKSQALNVKFFNTSFDILNEKVNTKIVHEYDFKTKTFNILQNDGNILNAAEKFNNYYVENMKGQPKPYPSLINTNLKKLNFNYENIYNLYGGNKDITLSKGLNKLLKSSVITNLGIEVQLKGQMFRRSGKFITIDRDSMDPKNKFDDRFLGTYFIINVDHTFMKDDLYINRIYAVKTYYFDNLKFNDNLD